MGIRTLIVISDDANRRDSIGRLAAAAQDAEVTKLDRGISLGSSRLVEEVKGSEGYDLIVHHCGATNGEYRSFVRAYRDLAEAMAWPSPKIVLFSGSPASVREAERAFANDLLVCPVAQEAVEENLRIFIEAEYHSRPPVGGGRSFEEIHWHLLQGYRETEYQLQVLSALLPFGAEWEADGRLRDRSALRSSSSSLRPEDFAGTESVIVSRVKELIAGGSSASRAWDSNRTDAGVIFINRLLATKARGPRVLRILNRSQEAARAIDAETSLDAALHWLAGSKTLLQWNWRLSVLRDHLLE
jgi:hypothetical protein